MPESAPCRTELFWSPGLPGGIEGNGDGRARRRDRRSGGSLDCVYLVNWQRNWPEATARQNRLSQQDRGGTFANAAELKILQRTNTDDDSPADH